MSGMNGRHGSFAIVGIIIFAFVAGVFAVVSHTVSNDYSHCVVTEKDRTTNSEGKSDMRVYTENCGTLSVGDNWLKGVTDSADKYSQIHEGKTYNFKATGWRFGLFSMFPKIYEIELVK